MTTTSDERTTGAKADPDQLAGGDPRLDKLVNRLPPRMGDIVTYLLKPSSRWVRIPAGILLILGGIFSILPFLGLWMLPLGLLLIAYDIPFLQKPVGRFTLWAIQKWASFRQWFFPERPRG